MDSSTAKGAIRRFYDNPDYVLVMANIEDVMNNTNSMQRISLSAKTKADDDNIIGDRVARAGQHWLVKNSGETKIMDVEILDGKNVKLNALTDQNLERFGKGRV